MDSFDYPPLGPDQIRLLILAPGSSSDKLACALSVEDLENLPSYSALSYVWGSEDRPNSIKCGHAGMSYGAHPKSSWDFPDEIGKCIKITLNLKDALIKIRHPISYRLLWVDSICINQDDVQERTQQVRLMDRIYGSTTRVLIYIGDEDEKTASTFGFTYTLSKKTHLDGDVRLWYPGVYEEIFKADPTHKLAKHAYDDPWIGWTELLARPWFTRLWTWQEIIVSHKATIYCGKHWMEWDVLLEACTTVNKSGMHHSDPRRARTVTVLCMETVRQNLAAYSRLDPIYAPPERTIYICNNVAFNTLLGMTRHTKTTDPRDKIFAILNICKVHGPSTKSYLVPDYTLSVREVYIRATAAWFHEGGHRGASLDFLNYAQAPNEDYNLPSWVPDWSSRLAADPLVNSENLKPRASANSKISTTFPSLSDFGNTSVNLVVRGFRLLTIKSTQIATEAERKHAGVIAFSEKYPTTDESYLDAYSKILHPEHPDAVKLKCNRPSTFWAFQQQFEASNHSTGAEGTRPPLLTQKDLDSRLSNDILNGWFEGIPIGRAFFVSTNGFMGLVPQNATAGDEICILFGLATPFVIRRQGGHFRFIGECFVYGLMDGEAIEELPEGKVEDFTFQ
jgi:hypothetical protein